MIVMAVNHDVEDYDRWKAGFDQYPPSMGGALFHRLNRNVDDPNNVTVVCGWNSAEDAIAFRDNPELKSKMGDAGVAGPPRFEIFEEVESVQY
jgi:heme-degrading monooxygenase HmoA